MARESHALSPEAYTIKESRQFHWDSGSEGLAETSTTAEGNRVSVKEIPEQDSDSTTCISAHQPPAHSARGKKQKGKKCQGSGSSSPSCCAFNSSDSYNEAGMSSSIPSTEAAFSQLLSMREMINKLLTAQKETQKQMEMTIAAPVTEEGRRLEAVLGRNMDKTVKANSYALWAKFQEESAKQEKSLRDRTQQMTSLSSNCLNKDMAGLIEKISKKVLGAVGQVVAHNIAPTIEKTVSAAISEAFQKGFGNKAVNQLEKSDSVKVEAIVARQIQAQFQVSGKFALQRKKKPQTMDWRHYCSCFILLYFFSLLPGALTSTSISDGILVYPISTGRNLLQAKTACPVSFEFQNYTIITSQCKPPQYPAKQCCDAFLQFACPFAKFLNDESNDCISQMHSYINLHRRYPDFLFSSVCQGTKEGLPCPALAPSQSDERDDTSISHINCKLSPVLMSATTFMWVFLLVLLF